MFEDARQMAFCVTLCFGAASSPEEAKCIPGSPCCVRALFPAPAVKFIDHAEVARAMAINVCLSQAID